MTTFNPGVYAVRAYDAMKAVTLAVNKAKMNTSLLVKNMLASNFSGLSGLVTPLQNESSTCEMNSNSIFRVANVVGKSCKEIRFWSNSSGFHYESQLNLNATSSLKNLSVLLWQGGLTGPPPRILKIGVLTNTPWGEPMKTIINGETIDVTSMSAFCIAVFIEAMKKAYPRISYGVHNAIWYLERNNKESEEHFRGPWYKQLGATFWIIGNTLFQSHGDKIGSFHSKTVILSWLLIVLIISSCFTTNLSSILVANQLKPMVDMSKIGCDDGTFVVNYLQDTHKFKQKKIVQIGDPNEYSDAFENGTITVACIESPYVLEFLSKHKNYAVYGETHMLGGFAFVLQKGNPMTA
ncbi:hypothetical protein LUZ61_013215 [Rhynchospora tenuis]|uniref:Ionotropic glutamate receptor C-terminal domain-containing protein n=1 Tax=Rhynchospora tenuis TaxID=198213 RepID=A0AAD5Z2K8_9POAL|nr:hypothetical protein LUZ61_013215 [Rhynchospora tenuis]